MYKNDPKPTNITNNNNREILVEEENGERTEQVKNNKNIWVKISLKPLDRSRREVISPQAKFCCCAKRAASL